MLIITMQVDAPSGSAQGVKEALAMFAEYFGDTKILKIEEVEPEQMRFGSEQKTRSTPRR